MPTHKGVTASAPTWRWETCFAAAAVPNWFRRYAETKQAELLEYGRPKKGKPAFAVARWACRAEGAEVVEGVKGDWVACGNPTSLNF